PDRTRVVALDLQDRLGSPSNPRGEEQRAVGGLLRRFVPSESFDQLTPVVDPDIADHAKSGAGALERLRIETIVGGEPAKAPPECQVIAGDELLVVRTVRRQRLLHPKDLVMRYRSLDERQPAKNRAQGFVIGVTARPITTKLSITRV